MGKITYRMLTDPNDPVFKRGMTVSHPDWQRSLKILIADSQKSTDPEQALSQGIFKTCEELSQKEDSKDSTS